MRTDAKNIELAVRNVLIDMDDTLVGNRADYVGPRGDCFMETLAAMVAESKGISNERARAQAQTAHDKVGGCITGALPELGIDQKAYWLRVVECFRPRCMVFPGAASMLRRLHETGFNLYPATTNGAFAISAKLAVGGLAEDMRAPYFRKLLGGSEVYPAGKSCPEFFASLLEKLGLAADETVMIGDNPVADLLHAQQAGIAKVILPRRTQEEAIVVEPDGGIYVKSLSVVPGILRLKR